MYLVTMKLCGMCLYYEKYNAENDAKKKAVELRRENGKKDLFGHQIKIEIKKI